MEQPHTIVVPAPAHAVVEVVWLLENGQQLISRYSCPPKSTVAARLSGGGFRHDPTNDHIEEGPSGPRIVPPPL